MTIIRPVDENTVVNTSGDTVGFSAELGHFPTVEMILSFERLSVVANLDQGLHALREFVFDV